MPCNTEDFPVPCDLCQQESQDREIPEGSLTLAVELKSCCYTRFIFYSNVCFLFCYVLLLLYIIFILRSFIHFILRHLHWLVKTISD